MTINLFSKLYFRYSQKINVSLVLFEKIRSNKVWLKSCLFMAAFLAIIAWHLIKEDGFELFKVKQSAILSLIAKI